MDRAARHALASIGPEDLKYAKDDELALYVRALELESQLVSPLTYAVTVSKASRYRHVEELDRWIIALLDGRMYFDGQLVREDGVFVLDELRSLNPGEMTRGGDGQS